MTDKQEIRLSLEIDDAEKDKPMAAMIALVHEGEGVPPLIRISAMGVEGSNDGANLVADLLFDAATAIAERTGHKLGMVAVDAPEPYESEPHSRACGMGWHDHGVQCSTNCPTCGGKPKRVAFNPKPVVGGER